MAINMTTIELPLNIPDATIYTLEGPDGGGKTTQAGLVVPELVRAGHDAVEVASPSSTELGQFLRANLPLLKPYERHTLFLLDMARLILDNPGKILVADRWTDSNLVSNKDSSPEESARWIAALPKPRKTFLLDIDPQTIVSSRPESVHDHSADLAKQQMKRERYLRLAETEPERFVVIDATLNRAAITAQIVQTILSDLTRI